jgi:hypothetical protein
VEPELASSYTIARNGAPTHPLAAAAAAVATLPASAAALAAARAKIELDETYDAEARAAGESLKIASGPETAHWDENRLAMLKMLTELFHPRHFGFTRLFLSPAEAAASSPPVLTLLPIRDMVANGEIADPFEFAWRVRHVIAACYLGHGNPVNGNPAARKAERLDALFEQQVRSNTRGGNAVGIQ